MVESTVSVVDGLDRRKLHFVDVDGIRTRYYEDGSGEPLLLLSGGEIASLYSLDSFSLNLPGLAQHFHVYALDKLGQGHTDNPRSAAEYTFDASVRHAYNFMRALGITGAHVAGHSRGGLMATLLALRHTELVKTLIIVDSASTAPEDPEVPSRAFYLNLGLPGGRSGAEEITEAVVRGEPEAQAYSRAQVTDDFIARMYEIARLPKTREAQRHMAAIDEELWQPTLNRLRDETLDIIAQKGIPVRTVMIWGFNDRSAPIVLGHRLFERICAKTPRAELHVLNGAGHYSFRDQYQAFNRALTSLCLG